MKKLMSMIVIILLSFTSCSAQKVDMTPRVYMTLQNALVTQVTEDAATLSYEGRSFEVDGTYVKQRLYYVVLEVIDCHKCPIVRGKTIASTISKEQVMKDINDIAAMVQNLKEEK